MSNQQGNKKPQDELARFYLKLIVLNASHKRGMPEVQRNEGLTLQTASMLKGAMIEEISGFLGVSMNLADGIVTKAIQDGFLRHEGDRRPDSVYHITGNGMGRLWYLNQVLVGNSFEVVFRGMSPEEVAKANECITFLSDRMAAGLPSPTRHMGRAPTAAPPDTPAAEGVPVSAR